MSVHYRPKSHNYLYLVLILIVTVKSSIALSFSSDKTQTDSYTDCPCFAKQFNGKLSLSSLDLHRNFAGGGVDKDRILDQTIKELRFAVDYRSQHIFGELHVTGVLSQDRPAAYRVLTFTIYLSNAAEQSIVLRDRIGNQCWNLPISEERWLGDRCSVLKNAKHRGDVKLNRGKQRHHKNIGKLYALEKHQVDEVDPDSQSDPQSFLLLTGSRHNSLPIMKFDTLDHYVTYTDMEYGLGDFQGANTGFRCTDSSKNNGSNPDGKRKNHDDDLLTNLLHSALKLHILGLFFSSTLPSRLHVIPGHCCGPEQWEATLVKTITYSNSQSNQVNQAVTSVPHMYVDHVAGKMAASIIEYVNNQPASNLSYIAVYGPSLAIYSIDWGLTQGAASSCFYLEVTDIVGAMRNSCMSSSYQFESTVRLGGDASIFGGSLRLNVWNLTETHGSFSLSAEAYIEPIECVTVAESYNWQSPTEKVWGTIIMSDVKSRITDPDAFAIPSVCSGITPFKVTSDQIRSAFSTVLSYAGR